MAPIDDALDEIITAVGARDFPRLICDALCRLTAFDLVAALDHRPNDEATILFDNFGRAGGRAGLARYARSTRRVNPMLAASAPPVWRASDYADAVRPGGAEVIADRREELGYRTIGWPARLEEIGLRVGRDDRFVEIGLYRDRARHAAPAVVLDALTVLRRPLHAAFRRNAALALPKREWRSRLTRREREVAQLLLLGCSSEAIGARLSISRHTVKDHRKRIFAKLGVSSLAELFALTADPSLGG